MGWTWGCLLFHGCVTCTSVTMWQGSQICNAERLRRGSPGLRELPFHSLSSHPAATGQGEQKQLMRKWQESFP